MPSAPAATRARGPTLTRERRCSRAPVSIHTSSTAVAWARAMARSTAASVATPASLSPENSPVAAANSTVTRCTGPSAPACPGRTERLPEPPTTTTREPWSSSVHTLCAPGSPGAHKVARMACASKRISTCACTSTPPAPTLAHRDTLLVAEVLPGAMGVVHVCASAREGSIGSARPIITSPGYPAPGVATATTVPFQGMTTLDKAHWRPT
mmetsp:Transcript_19159/g.56399  ORF Transcript_19159/g.56399 Transcript_19159/m.56399 type:complete len:211 (-) Transcript_19159:154-786(-)